jgi:hypothetical protein
MREMRNIYKSLIEILKGTRYLGRTRRRWEANIKVYLQETGYEGADRILVAQD